MAKTGYHARTDHLKIMWTQTNAESLGANYPYMSLPYETRTSFAAAATDRERLIFSTRIKIASEMPRPHSLCEHQ